MTDQEEFEKWAVRDYGLKKRKNGNYRYLRTSSAFEAWHACAEQKNAIIEQQAKEIEALRGFALRMWNYELVNDGQFEGFGLIDESGNPTKLLTGE